MEFNLPGVHNTATESANLCPPSGTIIALSRKKRVICTLKEHWQDSNLRKMVDIGTQNLLHATSLLEQFLQCSKILHHIILWFLHCIKSFSQEVTKSQLKLHATKCTIKSERHKQMYTQSHIFVTQSLHNHETASASTEVRLLNVLAYACACWWIVQSSNSQLHAPV